VRETGEPDIRNVGVTRIDIPGDISGWQVEIWAMEFVHNEPLESEFRQRIADALRQVSGVASAGEEDRETWFVTGSPSGKALAEAAARVVDDLAGRTRAYLHQRRHGHT